MKPKLEFIHTQDIYAFGPILPALAKDFGYVFYSTVFEWCQIIPNPWPHWSFKLIQLNGQAIGCCGLYSLDDKTEELWLSWLGLLPEFRNQGLGQLIMDYLEQEARKMNCQRLMSYVDQGGAPLNFYRRLNFEVIGTVAEFLATNQLRQIDGEEFEDPQDLVIQKNL